MCVLGWSGEMEQQKPSSTPIVQFCGATLLTPLQKNEGSRPFDTAPSLGKLEL